MRKVWASPDQRGCCACRNPVVSEDWGNQSHRGTWLVGTSLTVVILDRSTPLFSLCGEWKVLQYSSLTFMIVMLMESLSSERGGSGFRRNTTQGRPLVGHMTVAWEFYCFNPAPLKLACNLSVLFGWGQLIANCWCVSRWMSPSPAGLETALLGKLCWAFGNWDKCSFLWFGVLTVLWCDPSACGVFHYPFPVLPFLMHLLK